MLSEDSPKIDEPELALLSTIGFGGSVQGGLHSHPDGVHFVYPIGSTVVIRRKDNPRAQFFLHGHTNTVSCLAISKSGRYVASGQVTHMGFQADIIVWDFAKRTILKRLSLHKVKVEALAFSPNDVYLASLGGEDDGSVIVWDLAKGVAVCGSPASKESAGCARCIAYTQTSDTTFVTGGASTLRVWEVDAPGRKLRATDASLGQIKRVVVTMAIDEQDKYVYCGTTTGDLLQIALGNNIFKQAGPPKDKDKFSMGILSLSLTSDKEHILIGAGDGTVGIMRLDTLKIVKTAKVKGRLTSLTYHDQNRFLAGTSESNIFEISYPDLEVRLQSTCHFAGINDIAFPTNFSELFATCAGSDIRIWNAQTSSELLRITVPNLECNCIVFKKDGSSLISGWNDGKIRAFGPETGRLQYMIHDVHARGVTAIAVTDPYNDRGDFRIVSGGEDGQVRIWRITRQTQTMEDAMKEHKGTVTCIRIRRNNLECVSSSSDGSCIVWDLTRHVRNQVLFAPSFFKAVCYFPDESQLLTSGTDRKVAYWEAFDGSLIRELEGSQSDSINGLDISEDGRYFVIGGSDKLIKIYRYEEGDVVYIGVGHSADIHKVKISPDQKTIVSVSADGAIFRWAFPDSNHLLQSGGSEHEASVDGSSAA